MGRDRARRGGDGPTGLRSPAHAVRREGMAGDLLHDRDGALTHERDRHRMGANAVACDAARGVGGTTKDGLIKPPRKIKLVDCRRVYEVFGGTLGCLIVLAGCSTPIEMRSIPRSDRPT